MQLRNELVLMEIYRNYLPIALHVFVTRKKKKKSCFVVCVAQLCLFASP